MDYKAFCAVWNEVLAASGLRRMGRPRESLDLGRMEHCYEAFVEPFAGQDAAPWFVTARLAWTWDALQCARTATTEEDLLAELFDRNVALPTTTRPWLRVDITLNATLPHDANVPMLAAAKWSSWCREVATRIESIEPILPSPDGPEDWEALGFVSPGWLDTPVIEVACDPIRGLLVDKVSLTSWQPILLPRIWDDPERPADDPPGAQIEQLCTRLRSAAHAWLECLDHLGVR
jgi:hypothetical protein